MSISYDPNTYLRKAWQLCEAMPQAISIDNLLDTNRGDKVVEFCGKLEIVKSIIEAEQHSDLRCIEKHSKKIDLELIEKKWFSDLVKMLVFWRIKFLIKMGTVWELLGAIKGVLSA